MKKRTQPVKHGPVVLPSELVREILSWLPVKTLMQFKSVSKFWKSLITIDKEFAKLHLGRSPKTSHVLLTLKEEEEEDSRNCVIAPCSVRLLLEEPLSMIDEDLCYNFLAKYFVVGSSNGLVCVGSGNFYDFDFGTMDKFWVRIWNPATQLRSKKSPAFSIGNSKRFGFGYDDSRDTYKVVVLSDYPSRGKMITKTMVYCMGDSHWRNISSDPGRPLSLMSRVGKFVGGCVNWLLEDPNNLYEHIGDSEDDECDDIIQMAILSFDMREETYRFLSLPDTDGVPYTSTGFGVLGDCLCLYYNHEETHFIVWQMREFGVRESWTRLMSVSYAHLRCERYAFSLPKICLCEDGDILMLIHGFKAIKYNLRENSVKHVQHPDNKLWLNVNTYVQSLVLPR